MRNFAKGLLIVVAMFVAGMAGYLLHDPIEVQLLGETVHLDEKPEVTKGDTTKTHKTIVDFLKMKDELIKINTLDSVYITLEDVTIAIIINDIGIENATKYEIAEMYLRHKDIYDKYTERYKESNQALEYYEKEIEFSEFNESSDTLKDR